MPVNPLINNNTAVQETAVAVNQAVVSELKDINKQVGDKKVDDRNFVKKLLDSNSKTSAKEALINLVSTLAGSGIKLQPENFIAKTQRSAKDEHDMMLQSKEESSDTINITSSNTRITGAKKLNQNNKDGQGEQGRDQMQDAQKVSGTLQEYSMVFVQLIIAGGTDVKKRAAQLESQLKSLGISENELLNLQQTLLKNIRGQISDQIKDQLTKRFFSKEKSLEFVLNDKTADKTIRSIFSLDRLGGGDFGNYHDGILGVVKDKTAEIRSEVKDFVNDELKTKLISKHLGEAGAEKDIKNLIELGLNSGLSPQEFVKSWQKTMDNVGIVPPPPEAFAQSSIEFGMYNKKKQQSEFDFSKDDEKDLLINQLRAIYMKRAVNDTLRTRIETSFRMRKLKNGLIKLGVSFGELDQIAKEGKAVGRVKLLNMIKEAFYERATLYDLSGPAFKLIDTKIRGTIKNLEKLGTELTKAEIDSIRDTANKDMFDTARNEVEKTIILYESKLKAGYKNPGMQKKIQLMIKLVNRLKNESNIYTEFNPEERIASISGRGEKA